MNDAGLDGATNSSSTLSTSDHRLSHHTGAIYNGQTGSINNAVFAPGSTASQTIVGSLALRQLIASLLGGDQATSMASQIAAAGGTKHFHLSYSGQGLNFTSGDLHYALGHVDLPTLVLDFDAQVNGQSIVVTGTVSGQVTDLYDFDYDDGGLPAFGAEVQAGYKTLGTAGHIFTEEVNFDDSLSMNILIPTSP